MFILDKVLQRINALTQSGQTQTTFAESTHLQKERRRIDAKGIEIIYERQNQPTHDRIPPKPDSMEDEGEMNIIYDRHFSERIQQVIIIN